MPARPGFAHIRRPTRDRRRRSGDSGGGMAGPQSPPAPPQPRRPPPRLRGDADGARDLPPPELRARERGPARPLEARGGLHRAVLPRRPDGRPGWSKTTMQGTPVSPVYPFGPTDPHLPVTLPIGDWPSGVYYAQLLRRADGFAPFVVTPRQLGEHRGSSSCRPSPGRPTTSATTTATGAATPGTTAGNIAPSASTGRTSRGGCRRTSRVYDLPFLGGSRRPGSRWTSSPTATSAPSRRRGRAERAYDLVVFPGHDEYVTAREYDNVAGYRNLGGHLMFLRADEFYWHVGLAGADDHPPGALAALGRPEAGLVGVGLFRNNRGARVGAGRSVAARVALDVRGDAALHAAAVRAAGSRSTTSAPARRAGSASSPRSRT